MDNLAAYLPSSKHFRLQQLTGGVWAALAVDGTGSKSNAGIVDLGDRTLIFDTFWTPQAAQDLRQTAERLTGRPVAYVINSHRHSDHVFGNQIFPDADIIATAKTRELIAATCEPMIAYARANRGTYLQVREEQLAEEKDEGKRRQLALQLGSEREFAAALPTMELRLPNVTFAERMVFHGAQRSAEVISYGGGHTEDDSFLYLPGARIAFLGDLLSVQNHPSLWHGDPEEWIRIIQQIEMLDLVAVVPGHGPVGNAEDLALLRQYITTLVRMASEGVGGGKTEDEAAARAIPPPFGDWQATEVFSRNMRFLYGRLVRG
jgi:cyclase